ncbi:MAG: hypothetical protein A2W08_17805 [Candidatus Rokubacteria bacterium RBG_16_73_20]|nr:MAG: hypothetical protein A2W08_17805 [Candidatus Rokubacteria bacterium RBG_16_73_20]
MLGLIVLLQTLVVAVSGPATSPEYLPLRVAAAEGDFAREGLDVRLRTTRAEPGAAEALAEGRAHLAATTFEAMLRFGPRLPAQPPRLVFGLTAAPPGALLVGAAHAQAIRNVGDLRGRRVGVSTPGAPEQAWLGWLLARAGISPDRLHVVSLGSRGLVTALGAGEVDAALVREPDATRLLTEGRASLLVDLRTPAAVDGALGAGTVSAAVFARADRQPADAELAGFARALLAATERLRADRDLWLPDGLVSAAQVEQTIRLVRAHAPLPASLRLPDAERLLHLEPLRSALRPRPAR